MTPKQIAELRRDYEFAKRYGIRASVSRDLCLELLAIAESLTARRVKVCCKFCGGMAEGPADKIGVTL